MARVSSPCHPEVSCSPKDLAVGVDFVVVFLDGKAKVNNKSNRNLLRIKGGAQDDTVFGFGGDLCS